MLTRRRKTGTRSGMTLLEISIALAIFTAFATSAFLSVSASTHSYRVEGVSARLDRRARDAVKQVCARLRLADADSVAAVTAPASLSTLDFECGIGWVNNAPAFGLPERIAFEQDPNDADDGADNDGDGLVDEGRLVWIEAVGTASERRTVLTTDVSEMLEGEIDANGTDDNGNDLIDEPGFCLEFVGSHVVVRLTLEELDHLGNRIRRSATRSVTARNTEED
jgi:prepilin-type N-terminal cleavage/methylation domain-containing protein